MGETVQCESVRFAPFHILRRKKRLFVVGSAIRVLVGYKKADTPNVGLAAPSENTFSGRPASCVIRVLNLFPILGQGLCSRVVSNALIDA